MTLMGFGPQAVALIMVVMMVIVIAYTILGGMFSVVVTDFIQFVILSLGMLVATIAVLLNVSLTQMATVVTEQYGDGGINPLVNSRFGWMFIVWILISNLAFSGMVVGSLLTQKSYPPLELRSEETT